MHDWTNAKHLAIPLNAGAEEVGEVQVGLPHAEVFAVNTSQLDEEGRHLLGRDKKLLIVRPDGYAGFRGSIEKRTEWAAYGRQDGIA